MSGKTILSVASPATQTVEAVKSLIAYRNHGHEPQEMPAFYRLTAEMVLVQSNKGDAYYVVTPKACSCPSAMYRPGKPCKHQRAYFSPQKHVETTLEPVDSIGPKQTASDSIRPDMRGFRPFSLLPGEVEEAV